MKLVVGLGNPGPRYADTRHNVGFRVVDLLAQRFRAPAWHYDKRFEAQRTEGQSKDETVCLLKPMTFMNESGRSVAALLRFYKLPVEDLLAVYDDLDLPVGRIRVRSSGSSGGQKGMADILRHVGTEQVARVRVGIGRVHPSATVDYVLSKFDPSERDLAQRALEDAAGAIECWCSEGTEAAMNRFNRKDNGGGANPGPVAN